MRFYLVTLFLFVSAALSAQTITVYFEFNNFVLSNDARNTLNKFIASSKIKSVGFFGHTDQVGGDAYNEWLSVQRALAVKDYLISKGLKETGVSVIRGFGADRPVTTDPDPEFQQLNRRVSVTNEYKASPVDLAASAKQAAIHYGPSPVLIQPGSTQNSLTVTNTGVPKTESSLSNTPPEIGVPKPIVDKPVVKVEKVQEDHSKNISSVTEKKNTTTENSINSNIAKGTSKDALPNKLTDPTKEKPQVTANKEAVAKTIAEVPAKQEKKEVAKGSFADGLSKAVPSKSTGSNAYAPVVKQQKNEKLAEDIKDKSTKEGEHIVLRHINFYGGRHAFLPQAYPALDDLLETMQKIPTLEIEIQGHICCHEGEGDEIDFDSGEPVLSVTRAKAVYDFLLDNGIDKKRMSYKGLAHKFPIIKEETNEAEATINRRVEIKIIRK